MISCIRRRRAFLSLSMVLGCGTSEASGPENALIDVPANGAIASMLTDAGAGAIQSWPNDAGAADVSSPKTFEAVWKPTSVRLELSSFGFHAGSTGYDITRDLLSTQQLALLDELREIATPEGELGWDFVSYSIRITDQSGEVVEYRAAEENIIDSDEGQAKQKRTIDYGTLTPFLATFRCLRAKELGADFGDASATDPWAGVATFNSDPGCSHGVFVSHDTSHSYRKWQVDVPGTYRLSVVRCFQAMRLHLYDPSGEQELAVSALTEAPDCPTLVHHFATPGVYRIDLEKQKLPTAEHDTAGDARLRVRAE